jgi:aldose 1-epimerase
MAYSVQTHAAPGVTAMDPTIFVLDDGAGGRAEIWPALGFNCFRWQSMADGRSLDLLYCDPGLFADGRPTRSGIPILFPFPNRIRAGRFTWNGKEYQLPLNDGPKTNAIHGFACRRPWRVVDQGAGADSAHLTAEFHGDRDAPDCRSLWPTDYRIRVTYRLLPRALRIEAEVSNPDASPMPFGLGYHPYFRIPFANGATTPECKVQVPAKSYWVLDESLPTGECRPVADGRDLNKPRAFDELRLDDVLTDVPQGPDVTDGLHECGAIEGASGITLRLLCSKGFREMVVFTPVHREAFCIEPYTCTTDAANLQARGVDAGWLTLPAGGRWSGVVEMRAAK